MAARKISISMDEDLVDEVQQAAEAAGMTVSAWISEQARERIALLGELCAAAATADVVGALVVATAEVRGGTVLTSDPSDISAPAGHARRSIGVVRV